MSAAAPPPARTGGRRLAVVGGATSGLGRACARALLADGIDVLLWSRDPDRLASTAADLAAGPAAGPGAGPAPGSPRGSVSSAPGRAATGVPGRVVGTVAADAADPGAAAVVARAAAGFGTVDTVVLNAGGPPPVDAAATDPDQWRRSFQLLALTPIELATRLLPGMRAAGFGRVVAVLSSGVREPLPRLAYSNACRSALSAWMKTVAREVAADGVTVNAVLPGRIDTPRVTALDRAAADREGRDVSEVAAASRAAIPAGRYGRPEEFAAVVAFLATPAAGYVTGVGIPCDGGMGRSLP